MTFFGKVLDMFGINVGSIGSETTVVGFFGMLCLLLLGLSLLMMGYLSIKNGYYVVWMGYLSVALMSISFLEFSLIPGFPLMSIIGLFGGLIGVFISVLMFRNPPSPKLATQVCLAMGVLAVAFSVFAMIVEFYWGGGFLA